MRRTRIRRRGAKWSETKELDAMLRRLILHRDGACRKCGKTQTPGRGGAIEAAHIFPKGKYPSMRYRVDNVIALCHACHMFWAHKDPVGFTDWVAGVAPINALRLAAQTPGKVDRTTDRLYLESLCEKWGVPLTPVRTVAKVVARKSTKRRKA